MYYSTPIPHHPLKLFWPPNPTLILTLVDVTTALVNDPLKCVVFFFLLIRGLAGQATWEINLAGKTERRISKRIPLLRVNLCLTSQFNQLFRRVITSLYVFPAKICPLPTNVTCIGHCSDDDFVNAKIMQFLPHTQHVKCINCCNCCSEMHAN